MPKYRPGRFFWAVIPENRRANSSSMFAIGARPDRHSELARLEVLEGKTWNPPALAAPYLLVRHDRQAVCYELTLAAGSGGTR